MAERILNLVCPKCKNGIKHDTLTGSTVGIEISEYPEVTESGRCWCKSCQHGTYPNEDGLCIECLDRGRLTRLQPAKTVEPTKVEPKVEPEDKTITLKKTVPQQKQQQPTKRVIGTKK